MSKAWWKLGNKVLAFKLQCWHRQLTSFPLVTISTGVHHLSVLSPTIFCALLQWCQRPTSCHLKCSQLPMTTTQFSCQNMVNKFSLSLAQVVTVVSHRTFLILWQCFVLLLHSADLKFYIQKPFQLMKKQDRGTQNGLECQKDSQARETGNQTHPLPHLIFKILLSLKRLIMQYVTLKSTKDGCKYSCPLN